MEARIAHQFTIAKPAIDSPIWICGLSPILHIIFFFEMLHQATSAKTGIGGLLADHLMALVMY